MAFIAPFWADVDTRGGLGTVFFRSTTNETTLAAIKEIVSNSKAGFQFFAQFYPKWALIVTWEEVGYYEKHGDKVSLLERNKQVAFYLLCQLWKLMGNCIAKS